MTPTTRRLPTAATEPPEERGLARDQVRLLVATGDGVQHARFADLPRFLQPGDLVVVNTSATLAAAVDGTRQDGRPVVLHLSAPLDDGTWVVELRRPDGSGPERDGRPGAAVNLPAGASARLVAVHDGTGEGAGARLWRAALHGVVDVPAYLARFGRPITYSYVRGRWPLSDYQTVFAREPGSAEMPSAGRPFSRRVVTDLVTGGVLVAPVLLHAGVSSLEAGELPQQERFAVPPTTARLVEHVRQAGGRIVAVGTTVTRALESAADRDGVVHAVAAWTDLVLGPDRPARVVDGLITGWHDAGTSHLLLLEAVAGTALVAAAYREAAAEDYRWHEFGDSCLLLP